MAADREGLLRDVIENPADDTPRLVFADWCEENGELERGAFVREHVRLCGLRCKPSFAHDMKRCPKCVGLDALWAGLRKNSPGCAAAGEFTWMPGDSRLTFDAGWVLEVDRGFLRSVRLPHDEWLQHGPAMAREHPLERVELADREPYQDPEDGTFGWRRGTSVLPGLNAAMDAATLDARVWREFPGERHGVFPYWRDYPSRTDAVDALSAALLAWARSQEDR